MKNRTRFVAPLVAAAVLTACGSLPAPGGAASQPGALRAAAADREIALEALPTEAIDVPARPTRHAPRPTAGNALTAHVSPAETLPALLALIDGAESSIYLETFNFGRESFGEKLVPRLVAKARAGVEVKIVMDYVGSRFLKGHKQMLAELRAAGVDVRRYMPRLVRKEGREVGVNIQHRKIYLADGERALVGGVNLMKGFDTIHQDVLIGFRGPVVADLYKEFAHDYKAAGGTGALRQPAPSAPAGPATAQVGVTSPAEGRFEGRDMIYQAIDGARQAIVVENQYLWDDRLVAKLYAARARGVRVRVMVPGDEAKKVWQHVHAEELKRLVDRGAEARIYHGEPFEAHLHVKYYSVDDAWTAIGSTNGDTRALLDNQEVQIAVVDKAFAVNLRERLFEHDWAHRSKPFVYKPATFVTRPFRSLLEILDYYL